MRPSIGALGPQRAIREVEGYNCGNNRSRGDRTATSGGCRRQGGVKVIGGAGGACRPFPSDDIEEIGGYGSITGEYRECVTKGKP